MPVDIPALRGLLAAATSRPWAVESRLGDTEEFILTYGRGRYELGVIGGYFDGPDLVDGGADANLIVAAVNALPDLLDEIEALRGALARLNREYSDLQRAFLAHVVESGGEVRISHRAQTALPSSASMVVSHDALTREVVVRAALAEEEPRG